MSDGIELTRTGLVLDGNASGRPGHGEKPRRIGELRGEGPEFGVDHNDDRCIGLGVRSSNGKANPLGGVKRRVVIHHQKTTCAQVVATHGR